MIFRKIFPVMLKNEDSIAQGDGRLRCARIVGILEQFGEDMAWALNLMK